jgi:hypothetical protein
MLAMKEIVHSGALCPEILIELLSLIPIFYIAFANYITVS